jgi:pimeloyl-ACP methyl ester carboxylesterase
MIPDGLGPIFEDGVLVYSCWIAGRRYGTQWTSWTAASSDAGVVLDLLLEIDPAAAGTGGPLVMQRCRLITDSRLRPRSYVSESGNGTTKLSFGDDEVDVELRDGSTQKVPRGRAEFAFDRAMPGMIAAMIAELAHRGALAAPVAIELFDVSQFVPVPYKISPGAGATLLTSHREALELDGPLMRHYKLEVQGLEARLERPAPALPDWAKAPVLANPVRSYAPPAKRSFRLDDVRIPGPQTDIGATLTIPRRPIARVLFIGGSGTHDRHGISGAIDIGTHVIVDALAEAGVLGLRFDTRGAGNTSLGPDALELGLDSTIDDARACLAFLRDHPEGRELPLFLIGHSEGGIVAMVLAAPPSDCAGVVLMATPGRRIDEIVADQLAFQSTRNGLTPEQSEARQTELRELFRLIEADLPWVEGQVPDYLLPALRTRHWLKQYLARSPTALISALRCPVLICQGRKDFQVSAERDSPRLLEAARSAGLDVTYRVFSDLDHLFKHSPGDSTVQAYFDASRAIDREFLDTLTDWLQRQSRTPKQPKPST